MEVSGFHPTNVLAIRHVGSYLDCSLAFKTLMDFVLQNKIKPLRFIGLCYDDPDKTKDCRYDACIEIDELEVSKNLALLKGCKNIIRMDTIGGSSFIKIRHIGSYTKLYDVYTSIYSQRNYNFNFLRPSIEVYLNSSNEVNEDSLETEVYVPIIK